MNGDCQKVQELPKIFGEIRYDVVRAVGAGVVCYLTYRLVRYVYIRQHGRRVSEENKMMEYQSNRQQHYDYEVSIY